MKFKKKKSKRSDICLSLNCKTMEDVVVEISKYGRYCQVVEWCADAMEGAQDYTKEAFIEDAKAVKALCGRKKFIIDYKGNEEFMNMVLRWSMGVADIIDIDYNNPELTMLIREAKRKRTKVLVSYHVFDKMPTRSEIAEQYIVMEKTGADILKIACMANEEVDTYSILEAASAYSQLSSAKPIVAIAMGQEGQVSRICAGDFGSVMSYACGDIPTAPGQFNAFQLSKYMDKYYEEEK